MKIIFSFLVYWACCVQASLLPSLNAQDLASFRAEMVEAVENMKINLCLETPKANPDPATDRISIVPIGNTAPHFSTFTELTIAFSQQVECVELFVPRSPDLFSLKTYSFTLETVVGSPLKPTGTDTMALRILRVPPSVFYSKHDIVFRAFDNEIDGDGSDKIVLKALAPIMGGSRFTLTNARFNELGDEVWETDGNGQFPAQTVTYTGTDELPEGTDICFEVPGDPENGLLTSFSINGIPASSQFAVTDLCPGTSLELPDQEASNLFLVQGHFTETPQGMALAGSVIDVLSLGQSQEEYLGNGIPSGFESQMPRMDSPGSFYGYMECGSGQTVCEFLGQLNDPGNWSTSPGTYRDDLGQASVCGQACELSPCASGSHGLMIGQEEDCTLFHDGIPSCNDPVFYTWEVFKNNEWQVAKSGNINNGGVSSLSAADNEKYRLKVRCADGCNLLSNELIASCIPCIDKAFVGFAGECLLEAFVPGCSQAVFQWQVLGPEGFEDITGANSHQYDLHESGTYRAKVSECECDLLTENILFNNELEITATPEYTANCDFATVCMPPFALITDVITKDGKLSDTGQFDFPYCLEECDVNQNSIGDLAEELTGWLFSEGQGGSLEVLTSQCGRDYIFKIISTSAIFESLEIDIENTVHDEAFERTNCIDIVPTGSILLSIGLPCEDAIIDWSHGATEAEISVPPTGTYSVDVDCPNDCIHSGQITFGVTGNSLSANQNSNTETASAHIPVSLKQNKRNWRAYPVPTKHILNVEIMSDKEENRGFEIMDIRGSKIMAFKKLLAKGNNHFLVELENIPTGFYLLRSDNPNGYLPLKFIVHTK